MTQSSSILHYGLDFTASPIWRFYLYWLPSFSSSRFGLTIDAMALSQMATLVCASVPASWALGQLLRKTHDYKWLFVIFGGADLSHLSDFN